jgi:diguanylate cyclase (GGDEF)-like protein/PAS domain S-box-containing protein
MGVWVMQSADDPENLGDETWNLDGSVRNTAVAGAFGLAQAAAYAFIASGSTGQITFVNRAAEDLFGYPPGDMIGRNIDVIVPERFRASHEAGLARMIRNEPSRLAGKTIEVTAKRRDGTEFPAEFTLSVWRDHFGLGFGAILRDISEWRARDERLKQLAHHDTLTGLPNRACFEEALQKQLDAGGSVAVLMLDLDGFKEVNDSWGHDTGDAVLQTLAIRLPGRLPQGASLARFGGDEFAVLLPGLGDPLDVAAQATSLLDAFVTPLAVDGRTFHLGVSIGGGVSPAHGDAVGELIGNADLALYRAKQEGKRRFRLFEPVMRSLLLSRIAMQEELRSAARNHEFVLHYQPQVDLQTTAIVGVEALLRWQHPTRGLLMPDAFLSQLEEHPLVLDVGRWILNEACKQAKAWCGAGHRLRMGVNLFAAQAHAGTLEADVLEALNQHRLRPEVLELEVTETIALRADEAMLGQFEKLQRQGIGIAFDDFGTGYASLSSLKRFPLTRLKIDRGFVRDLLTDPHDAAVVRAIVQIGQDVGLEVIAEGIETSAQEATLLRMGCEQGQGYRYGKASPAAEIRCFLESTRLRTHNQ